MRQGRIGWVVVGSAVAAALMGGVIIATLAAPPARPPITGNVPTGPDPTLVDQGPAGFAPGIGIPAPDPIPWTGVTWDPLPTTGIDPQPGGGLRGLIHAGDVLVALGRADDPRPLKNPNGLDDVAAIWLSRDGAAWQVSPIVAGVPPDSVTELTAVAAGPRGVVAGGGICCRLEVAAMWWSPDGLAWEPVDVPGLGRGSFVLDLAAGPDGFVAIGGVGDPGERGAIWTSADGQTWSAVDAGGAGLVRGYLWSVAATDTGFVVVGSDDPGVENADAAVWASVGLEGWRRVAIDDPALAGLDEAELSSIVPFAGGLFAVGGTGASVERKQCEDLLGGAAMASLSDIALSCGWLREMTWHSPDGETWARTDPYGADGEYPPEFVGPPPGRAAVGWTHIVAGGPGLVALQDEISRDEESETMGIWSSADGAAWTRIADTPFTGADSPIGFAADGRRLYVLTERGNAVVGTVRP